MAQTLDGYTITTIEQEGDYAGQDVGRLWFKTPQRHEWCWYGGFANEVRRQDVLAKAQTLTFKDFDDWWETDKP